MILLDLSEKALREAFYQILEYSRSREFSLSGGEGWGDDPNRKFKVLLDDELRLHFERILQDFDSRLANVYTKEICIEIREDGKAELQQEQIFDIYQLKEVFLDLYKRYQSYEFFPILRRLLLSRACLKQLIDQQPNIKVSKELIGKEVSRYILLCYIDHNFLPIPEHFISSPFFKCFNKIKKNIETLKPSTKYELYELIPNVVFKNDVGTFKKIFSEKLIRKNFSRRRQQYDLILKLCYELLERTLMKLRDRGQDAMFGSITINLLFEWLLRKSLIYEIYVYRKLIDAGIPCMFRVELENMQGEFDLVYCTKSRINVVEVKSGSLEKDISEKMKLLEENGIGKYVIICPDEGASEVRSDSKYDQVDVLSFTELSDVTKLSKLVVDL